MKNKKTVDLKLQHRISKKNSFSRYLENTKFQNILMKRYSYGMTYMLPPLQNYFLPQSSPFWVINDFFYLKKKLCLVLEISRFFCFCEIYRFQNLWLLHWYCCIMQLALILISFESLVLLKWNCSNTSVLYGKHF